MAVVKATKRARPDPAIMARIRRERRQYVPFASPNEPPKRKGVLGKRRQDNNTQKPDATPIRKVQKGKVSKQPTKAKADKVKQEKAKKTKKEKVPAVRKVGNERLVPRPDVKEYSSNPFIFGKTSPEFVSSNTLHRAVYRALKNKDMKEFRRIASEKTFNLSLLEQPFSHLVWENPKSAVFMSKDKKLIDEFLKELPKLNKIERQPIIEPNLLQRRSTGHKNRYMIGRRTRDIQMSRGGREGNNALIDYETYKGQAPYLWSDPTVRMMLTGMDFGTMDKINSAPGGETFHSGQIVEMVRFGLREEATNIMKLQSHSDFNELHKVTLEGKKLPDKILSVSIKKKAFDNRNITPMHTAAINPDPLYLKTFHSIEPNISMLDTDNWTVAHYAAVCSGSGPLKYLISINTPLLVMNKREENPLHCAARAGRIECIKVLLDWFDSYENQARKAANEKAKDDQSGVDTENEDGDEAPRAKKAKTVKVDPSKSIINYKDKRGWTALHLAVLWGQIEAVKLLLKHPKIDVEAQTTAADQKISSLALACATGQLEIAKLLIEQGKALIESKDKLRRSPLLHAAMNGQDHVVAYLLKKGADLKKADSSGNSPAHYAAAYGFLSTLKVLAEVDSTCLSAQNDWHLTPLSVAYLKGHYGIVSWLLDGEHSKDVDINCKDNEGVTLISSLLSYFDENFAQQLPEQIKFLTERGADCSIADGVGTTPLDIFASLQIPLCEKLAKKDPRGLTIEQYRNCIDMILKAGGQVVGPEKEGPTPFQIALDSGNLILAEYLLSKVQDKKSAFITKKWNLLASLFELPAKVYNDKGLWPDDKAPLEAQYEITNLLDTVLATVPEKAKEWLNEKVKEDTAGTPVTNLGGASVTISAKELDKSSTWSALAGKIFAVLLGSLKKVLKFAPETVNQADEVLRNDQASLIHISLRATGDLRLLDLILEVAMDQGRLAELLSRRNGQLETVLQAAINILDEAKVIKILRVSKEQKCANKVHNALIQKWIEVDEKRVSLSKSVLHLLVEKEMINAFDHLELTNEEWVATDLDTSLVLARHEPRGNSAYHYGCRKLNSKTVSMLKKLKLPLEPGLGGMTPLHVAVDAERTYSADAFIEPIEFVAQSADVNARDDKGRTALFYAFTKASGQSQNQCDPIAVVSLLLRMMDRKAICVADEEGNTALHLAAMRDANICAVTLLHHGCVLDAVNKEQNTALGLAIYNKWPQTALTLIQAKADIHKQIYGPKPTKRLQSEWTWITETRPDEEQLIQSIPRMVVRNEWHSMVYVILDLLEKSPTTVGELAKAALSNGQNNFSQYLLKLLESSLASFQRTGQSVDVAKMGLMKAFIDGMKENLNESSGKVLSILLDFGIEWIDSNGESEILEAACRRGFWRVVMYLKNHKSGFVQWPKLSTKGKAMILVGLVEYWINWSTSEDVKTGIKTLASKEVFEEPVDYPKIVIDGYPYSYNPPELTKMTPIVRAIQAHSPSLIVHLLTLGCPLPQNALLLAVATNQRSVVKAVCEGVEEKIETNQIQKKSQPKANFMGAFIHNRKRLPVKPAMMNGTTKKRRRNDSNSGTGSVSDSGSNDGDGEENASESEEENESETESENGEYHKVPKLTIQLKQKVRLDYKDEKGQNVFHYLITPTGWENTELLEAIFNMDKKLGKELLNQADNNGLTPRKLAAKRRQCKLHKAMNKLIGGGGTSEIEKVPPQNLASLVSKYDINADAKQFIEKYVNSVKEKDSEKPEDRTPHSKSGYEKTGEIVKDEENGGQLFRVLLNKTDLQYGTYGFHNYYRMELIKRKDVDLFIIFTHWGRIGDNRGEHQTTPFSDYAKATKEFKSIFRQKCGQDWGPLDQFKDIDKKYRLVKQKKRVHVKLHRLPIELNVKENQDSVYKFIKDIANVKSLAKYLKQVSIGNVQLNSPLGEVSQEDMARAREVLKEVNETMESIEKIRNEKVLDADKLLGALTKLRQLSSKFFSYIPMGGFDQASIPVLDNAQWLKYCEEALNNLEDVEIATRILCAASWRNKECDSISYIQSALESTFRALSPKEPIAQRILQYIRQTSKVEVLGMMEVTSRGPTERFNKYLNEEGHVYLWHGTKAVNLMSIIKHGFHDEPSNALQCGQAYGKGVYFADCFEKSQAYSQESASGVHYMLLCQIAPGKILKNKDFLFEHPRQFNFDTRYVEGVKGPDPLQGVNMDGVTLPCGPIVAHETKTYWGSPWSEYIVRDATRTLPKYIVIWKT